MVPTSSMSGVVAVLSLLALAVLAQGSDMRCYSCSSYMSQCKERVNNGQGDVFKTRCKSKCFARIGEDGATYRGCFDGFREIDDLVYEYSGCQNQTWNNRALRWCLCDTDLCNGESLDNMARQSSQAAPSRSYNQYEDYNDADSYYSNEKDEYDQYYKSREEPSYETRRNTMDKYAKMGAGNQGEPYENIVETNYGYDVAHNLAPLAPNSFPARKAAQEEYYPQYDSYPHYDTKYVEEPQSQYIEQQPNPYVDPRLRERPTFYVEERVPEAAYYHQQARQPETAPTHAQYYEERTPPSYYEEESRQQPAYIKDDGVYKQNYEHEQAYQKYAPEPREGPSYVEEVGYDEPVAAAMRAPRPSHESYMPYKTESPDYVADYDNTYEDPQTSAPYTDFTTKVQRVSPQLASKIRCTETGYYQNPNDCKQFVACLIDPHSKTPIMHLMECPDSLVWDNSKKICMEYSTTCSNNYYDYPEQDSQYKEKAPSQYVEEREQEPQGDTLDTDGYQQGVGEPDIITYYPDDNSQGRYQEQYLSNSDFKTYGNEEEKYETNKYADEYH